MTKCAVFMIGLPGSGKTTAATYLQDLGFFSVSAGDVIRSLCQNEGILLSRENLSAMGRRFLSEHGEAHFAELLLQQAGDKDKVVFEGIRPPDVLLWLKRRIPMTLTIFLEAPERERLDRLLVARGEDESSYKKVMAFPMEQDILQIKSLVDVTIQNSGDVEDFYLDLKNAVGPMLSACE
jgi:dephospho-CoA kinase